MSYIHLLKAANEIREDLANGKINSERFVKNAALLADAYPCDTKITKEWVESISIDKLNDDFVIGLKDGHPVILVMEEETYSIMIPVDDKFRVSYVYTRRDAYEACKTWGVTNCRFNLKLGDTP